MCGIWAVLGEPMDAKKAKGHLATLQGRGPEGSRILEGSRFQLGFTRLAINGLTGAGMQPFQSSSTSSEFTWICNGEIYNHAELEKRYTLPNETGSDCAILGPLFERLAPQTDAATFFRALDGVFAIVIVDTQNQIAYIARDPYGVRPLFIGYQFKEEDGRQTPVRICISSELKALPSCSFVEPFPPGHYAAYDLKSLTRIGYEAYHTVPFLKSALTDTDVHMRALRESLEWAVKKRVHTTERPIAALLSGGLDSSLVAALVQRELRAQGRPPLKTFSIGFEGSSDLAYAEKVAAWIGSDHTQIVMTPQEFFETVPQIIKDIETFDITTVRASVGNYLVSREIARRTDCKVVFNGDGSDEVFGGYLYFQKAPSDEAFEYECCRLLGEIHTFDVLRSDRSISAHGLEARTPFLDKAFVATAMMIPTSLRRPSAEHCEKWILRKAFEETGLLPNEVLWRRKEAFSDGVSGKEKSWFQECQERALEEVGEEWEIRAKKLVYLPPHTPEAYYYRALFETFYKGLGTAVVPHYWMPQWTAATDPSARTLDVYTIKST